MPRFAGGRPPLHSQGFRLQMASQIPVPNFEEGSTYVALDVSSFRSRIRDDVKQSHGHFGKGRDLGQGAQHRRERPAQLAAYIRYVSLRPPGADCRGLRQGHFGATRWAEAPSYADEEASFADLKRRIAKTIAFVKSFKPGDIDGSEDRDITLTIGGQEMHFKGRALPFALRTAKFLFSRDHRLRPDARLRCYNRQAGLHRRNLSADLAMNMLRFLNEVSSLAIVAAAEIYSIGLMPPVAGNEAPIASASTKKRRDSNLPSSASSMRFCLLL